MSAIFVSHSSKDNARAKDLERRLDRQHHHSVFLDLDPEKGIVGGQSWERTLYRKLRACRAVIAICTDDYLQSHWCFAEIALARMEGKPVIALLADPLDNPARIPGILTERQLIDLRTNEEEGFKRLWRALEELDLRGVASDWNPKEPPYLGLNAYQEEHAPVFFGREEESLAGIELLDRGAPGLIMVLGASGSGKSSLVRAGILPRLRSREDWLILDPFRPGRDPWAELTESLAQGYGRYARAHLDESGRRERIRETIRGGWLAPPPVTETPAVEPEAVASAPAIADERVQRLIELLEQLHDSPPLPLAERVRNYLQWSLDDLRRTTTRTDRSPVSSTTPLLEVAEDLRRLAERRDARVLLVVDQFEELLGIGPGESGVSRFLELVRASIEAEHSPLTVLCTMRSDFLGLFQRHRALQGADFESLSLGPMRVDAMRRVIEMPARLAAIEIEEGLADRLLADTETPDALPLLSFTLWVMCRDRGEDGRLEVSAYDRLGGLQGTITREADAVLAAARRDRREDDLRRALLQMARLSEDGSYVRRPVDWDSDEVQRVAPILSTLVDRRVLVTRLDGDRRVIEVAHEALFRAWTPLRGWLENARAELLLKQQVERDAAAWQETGRPADALWRGGRLLQARDLIAGHRAREGADAAEAFVRAGMRRRMRQRLTLVSIVVAVVAVLTGFLGFALVQADHARQQQARALDMARVSIAGEWLQKDPTSGALVLLEVTDPANTRFAARRLSEVLARGVVAAEYRHEGPVHSVAISADGSRVVTTSAKAAMVWDTRSGRLLRTLPHDGSVIAASFDPTGRFVVTRSGEVGQLYCADHTGNSARVWDADTGVPRFTVTHDQPLNGAVFSPDGRFLVTTSDDNTAQLWDVQAGRRRFTLQHQDRVHDAVFSPDGSRLVTLSGSLVRVWALDSDQPVRSMTYDSDLRSASFSPDGASLVAAGYRGVQAWDSKTGDRLRRFAADLVNSIAFSADGRYIVTASWGEARVWDFATGSETFKEPIVQRDLAFAGFSSDGSLVITTAGHGNRNGYSHPPVDSAVRYWDARTGESRMVNELRFASEPMTVGFGPRRQTMVLNSATRVGSGRPTTLLEDPTARLWNLSTGDRRLLHNLPHDKPVSSVSFSPDGRRLLTVSGTAARLWDTDAGTTVAFLKHDKDVNAATFAPDGRSVVTASDDGTARVWDVDSGQERFAAKHKDGVGAAVLVAGGRLLATMSGHTTRLWTVGHGTAAIGAQLIEMPDDGDMTRRDDWTDNFSPDGKLVVVRADKTAQVWDVAAGKKRFTLEHDGWVRIAAFIADGRLLVTGADEKAARVWDMATGRPKFTLPLATQLQTISVSPDGRTVLTVDEDGATQFWDTATGKARSAPAPGCGAEESRFIAGGTLAVTWSRSGRPGCETNVVVWDAANGAAKAAVTAGDLESIGFSANGRVMFTTHGQRFGSGPEWMNAASIVRVWDVDTGEERFADPFRSSESLTTAALSPDGNLLATLSGSEAATWAVGARLLQTTVAAATTVCLTPEFRRQNLGESDAESRRAYAACERGHGR